MVRAPRVGGHGVYSLVLTVHLFDDAERAVATVGTESEAEGPGRIQRRPRPVRSAGVDDNLQGWNVGYGHHLVTAGGKELFVFDVDGEAGG